MTTAESRQLHELNALQLEKIGSANFYWSFPSKAAISLKNRVDELRAAAAADTAAAASLATQVGALAAGQQDAAERAAQLARLEQLRGEESELNKKLAAYAESDPAMLADLVSKARQAKEAADRWCVHVCTFVTRFVTRCLCWRESGSVRTI